MVGGGRGVNELLVEGLEALLPYPSSAFGSLRVSKTRGDILDGTNLIEFDSLFEVETSTKIWSSELQSPDSKRTSFQFSAFLLEEQPELQQQN